MQSAQVQMDETRFATYNSLATLLDTSALQEIYHLSKEQKSQPWWILLPTLDVSGGLKMRPFHLWVGVMERKLPPSHSALTWNQLLKMYADRMPPSAIIFQRIYNFCKENYSALTAEQAVGRGNAVESILLNSLRKDS